MNYQKYFKEELADEELFRAFAIVLPYLNTMVRDDMAFALSDKEKYLSYAPAEGFDLNLRYGTEVVDLVKECIAKRSVIRGELSSDVLGRALKVIAMPVKNSKGEIIGVLSDGIDMEDSMHLVNNIQEVSDSINQVSDSINQIAVASSNLAEAGQRAIELTRNTMSAAEKTKEVLELIKSIADQSNLLGLNAGIESARAGEYGRGFNVVANEIRKLATQSKESTGKIKAIIDSMYSSVQDIAKAIEETAAVTEEQAATTQEISATVENINQHLLELKDYSKRFL